MLWSPSSRRRGSGVGKLSLLWYMLVIVMAAQLIENTLDQQSEEIVDRQLQMTAGMKQLKVCQIFAFASNLWGSV